MTDFLKTLFTNNQFLTDLLQRMADFCADRSCENPADATSSRSGESRDVTIVRASDERSVGSSNSWETMSDDASPDGWFLLLVLLF